MELTGLAKENFFKWLYSDYFKEYYNYQIIWQLMGESARFGVYVDWFETVGIFIEIIVHPNENYVFEGFSHYDDNGENSYNRTQVLTDRNECLKLSVKYSNEIYNEKQQ